MWCENILRNQFYVCVATTMEHRNTDQSRLSVRTGHEELGLPWIQAPTQTPFRLPSSRGLGHRPFTAGTPVRIRSGAPRNWGMM